MNKKLLLILPIASMLIGCGGSGGMKPARDYGDDKYYALFMYNYPRVSEEAPSGNTEKLDNALYLKVEVNIGDHLSKPETDPERNNYEFKGWFKDKNGDSEWNFTNDTVSGSTYLYAKWGKSQGEEYIEPEYVYPERIITDMNYRVTGILNKKVEDNKVDLTAMSINRLKKHKENVAFAVNYERKEGVTLTTATFDEEEMKIHLEVSSGETFNIHVNDITAELSLKTLFPGQNWIEGYETKAANYEAGNPTYINKDGDEVELDNYHIALMGSSSMENWSTSKEDMAPIATYNHGIGGTTVQNWTESLLERLTIAYSPKAVVYYVGVNNIINQGETGEQTGEALKDLFDKTHEYLPNTHIFYILINKLPSYPHYQEDFDTANNMAKAYASEHDCLTCIDAGVGLLKENGLPHAGYFLTDGLHMSRYGYVLWGAEVKKAIINWLNK